jgi:uncharacterized protein
MSDATENGTEGAPPLQAGDFASWIGRLERAIRGADASEVPCDGCTACCRSGQFVHVAPDESDTLAHIPPELLFPAPLLPEGHRVLATAEEGNCPMLVDDRCSIYEHRPRACRTYDCRIFAATGVDVGIRQKAVARRVARWQFTFESEADQAERDACQAAAVYLNRRADYWEPSPPSPTRLAAGAVIVRELFLAGGDGEPASVTSEPSGTVSELTERLARVTGAPLVGRPLPDEVV